MHLKATIANALWSASNLPAYCRYCHALGEPQVVQENKLRAYLERNAQTAFGMAHGFSSIRSYEEFARRIPLGTYDQFEPWIEKIQRGEQNVLTRERVTHLIPTSGSTGARKLIPFTAGLQNEFNAAIGAWMIDLQRTYPGIMGGPAYWSVTPVLANAPHEDSAVPIGFDTDTAYLAGGRRRLADAIMAVPSHVQRTASLDVFRYTTLLHLLRCRELRLISVWHPSFLMLLLESLPVHWDKLSEAIDRGVPGSFPPSPRRAEELRGADPLKPESLWPELRGISCWDTGAARLALAGLRRYFPNVTFQPKGLIATEALVTLPMGGHYPLAIRSHFFEFIDEAGKAHQASKLHKGAEYEIVITTAGGLWRYRLGDRVRVTGFVKKTPALVFLERAGCVSDLCGEKLTEAFTTKAVQDALTKLASTPRFVLLAPDKNGMGPHYTLYVEGEIAQNFVETLEGTLRRNPHYAYCRDLGQLLPLRMFMITGAGYEKFASRQMSAGARLGDVKPAVFSRSSGWSETFTGKYI